MARLNTFPPRSTDSRQPPPARSRTLTSSATDFTFSLLTATTMSPRLTPSRAAGDFPLTSSTTTPSRVSSSMPTSWATAGERLATLQPVRGWRPRRSRASRGGSSTGATSVIMVLTLCPLRKTPSAAAPPIPFVTKRYWKPCASCTGLSATLTTLSPPPKPPFSPPPPPHAQQPQEPPEVEGIANPEPVRAAGLGEDGGINADQPSVHVDQSA